MYYSNKTFGLRRSRGTGWQSDRIIDAMNESIVAEDFYCAEIGQVQLHRWSKGRIVLLGDAAACPSPASAMGTSTAMVGAYALTGEILKHCGADSKGHLVDVQAAFQGYEGNFRPWVDKVQQLPPGTPAWGLPRTWFGIWLLQFVAWLMATIRIDKLAEYFGSDYVKGYNLPSYPMPQ